MELCAQILEDYLKSPNPVTFNQEPDVSLSYRH